MQRNARLVLTPSLSEGLRDLRQRCLTLEEPIVASLHGLKSDSR